MLDAPVLFHSRHQCLQGFAETVFTCPGAAEGRSRYTGICSYISATSSSA